MLPALDYNTKFGRIQQDAVGAITFNPSQPTITDWIARHSGLQKYQYNLKLLATALGTNNDRDRYITWKRASLARIAANTKNLFAMEFKRHLDAGTTEHVAKMRAIKYANEYKNKMIKSHEKQFPEEFTYEQAVRLLKIEKNPKKNDD